MYLVGQISFSTFFPNVYTTFIKHLDEELLDALAQMVLWMTQRLHPIRMSMSQSSWDWFTSCGLEHTLRHYWMGVVWQHWIGFLFLHFNRKWTSWQGSAHFLPFCSVKAVRVLLKREVKVRSVFRKKPNIFRHGISIKWNLVIKILWGRCWDWIRFRIQLICWQSAGSWYLKTLQLTNWFPNAVPPMVQFHHST